MTKEAAKAVNLQVDFPLSLLPRNVNIQSVMANGMFSTVYKAVYKAKSATNDASCEMPFVVKHIKSSNHPKRVLTEMCLLSKLRGRHHIIPVWSLVSYDFSYLVMMPYFTHDSFSSFFRDLSRKEIANYMYALLDALAYIHQLNVTHRDIKPTNFLYDRRTKRFALIDFGLAEKESRAAIRQNSKSSSKKSKTNLTDPSNSENDCNVDPPPVLSCIMSNDVTAKALSSQKKGGENSPAKAENSSRKMPNIQLPDPNVIGPSPKKSVLSPPAPQLFVLGRVGAGLTVAKAKPKLSAHLIRRRLRFSDVLNVEGTEEPTVDKTHLTIPPANDNAMDVGAVEALKSVKKDEVFSRIKSSDSGYSTASSLHAPPNGCRCDGPATICGICQKAPEIQAQRSGTTGYRAPEVLLRSRSQTIAIDVWAAGVVLLIILTGRYPFFTAKVDLEAVCQLMTIFGRRKIAELASELGLVLLLPSSCPISEEPPISLGDLCRQLRSGVPARRLFSSKKAPSNVADLEGKSRKRTFNEADLTRSPFSAVENNMAVEFTRLAFDLLSKLLEVRPSYRISAEEALKHEFFTKFRDASIDAS